MDGASARVDKALVACWEKGKDQSFRGCDQTLIDVMARWRSSVYVSGAIDRANGPRRQLDGVEVKWAPVRVRSGNLWRAAVKGFGEWLQIILKNVKNAYRQKLTRSLARNATTPPDD